jgi:hypothetical protein
VFEPTRTSSFPVRDATKVFVHVPHEEENYKDIPVMITVLAEFPATADLRAASVDTRTVGPPLPPVVLRADHAVSGEDGQLNKAHPSAAG